MPCTGMRNCALCPHAAAYQHLVGRKLGYITKQLQNSRRLGGAGESGGEKHADIMSKGAQQGDVGQSRACDNAQRAAPGAYDYTSRIEVLSGVGGERDAHPAEAHVPILPGAPF